MKYKHIITGGCSFSSPETPYVWPLQLEKHINRIDESVTFAHRGLSSQGQDLIAKKTMFAIDEALKRGIPATQIAVFVMWSSNDRLSFFVNDQEFIKEVVNNWELSEQGWSLQFGDLKNNITDTCEITTKALYNNKINYNRNGGWLITSLYSMDNMQFIKDAYTIGGHEGRVHRGLEYIILLQSYCKSLGIKLYQQYFMDLPYTDFESLNKSYPMIQYLYNALDYNTFIFPENSYSIHGFLKDNPECFKSPEDSHPNGLGHRRWLTEVMIPHLNNDDFFN